MSQPAASHGDLAAEAHRQAKKFLDSAQVYLRINGVKVADQYWPRPVQMGEPGEHLWVDVWTYPAG